MDDWLLASLEPTDTADERIIRKLRDWPAGHVSRLAAMFRAAQEQGPPFGEEDDDPDDDYEIEEDDEEPQSAMTAM